MTLEGHDNQERERERLTLKKSGRNVDVTAAEQWRHRVAELEALSLSLHYKDICFICLCSGIPRDKTVKRSARLFSCPEGVLVS